MQLLLSKGLRPKVNSQEVAVDDAAAHLAQHEVVVELPDLQGGEDIAVIEEAELIEDGFIREKPSAVQRLVNERAQGGRGVNFHPLLREVFGPFQGRHEHELSA